MPAYAILNGGYKDRQIPAPSAGQPAESCDAYLAADGKPCAMLLFPFVGRKRVECYIGPEGGYVTTACKPVVLSSGDGIGRAGDELMRLIITAGIAWLLWRQL